MAEHGEEKVDVKFVHEEVTPVVSLVLFSRTTWMSSATSPTKTRIDKDPNIRYVVTWAMNALSAYLDQTGYGDTWARDIHCHAVMGWATLLGFLGRVTFPGGVWLSTGTADEQNMGVGGRAVNATLASCNGKP